MADLEDELNALQEKVLEEEWDDPLPGALDTQGTTEAVNDYARGMRHLYRYDVEPLEEEEEEEIRDVGDPVLGNEEEEESEEEEDGEEEEEEEEVEVAQIPVVHGDNNLDLSCTCSCLTYFNQERLLGFAASFRDVRRKDKRVAVQWLINAMVCLDEEVPSSEQRSGAKRRRVRSSAEGMSSRRRTSIQYRIFAQEVCKKFFMKLTGAGEKMLKAAMRAVKGVSFSPFSHAHSPSCIYLNFSLFKAATISQ